MRSKYERSELSCYPLLIGYPGWQRLWSKPGPHPRGPVPGISHPAVGGLDAGENPFVGRNLPVDLPVEGLDNHLDLRFELGEALLQSSAVFNGRFARNRR